MAELAVTPGQTVGPFFHYALPFDLDRELAPAGSMNSLVLHGHVYDGDGRGVPDALLEVRQADEQGTVPVVEGSLWRASGHFTGWGRTSTDSEGRFWFRTVEPGPADSGGLPFIAAVVFARGLLDRLFTRIYLPAPDEALAADRFLGRLDPAVRRRLVARREDDGSLRYDVHLQGDQESVFLTYPRMQEQG